MNRWVKVIAALEVAGGIFGVLVLGAGTLLSASAPSERLLRSLALPPFLLSLIAGLCLWQGARTGYRLSLLVQALQIPKFLIAGVAYRFVVPAELFVGFQGLARLAFGWYVGADFRITVNPGGTFLLGINLVALASFLYLRRLGRAATAPIATALAATTQPVVPADAPKAARR